MKAVVELCLAAMDGIGICFMLHNTKCESIPFPRKRSPEPEID
jgi:hypothetical protein